jgi:hypothetical protein
VDRKVFELVTGLNGAANTLRRAAVRDAQVTLGGTEFVPLTPKAIMILVSLLDLAAGTIIDLDDAKGVSK